MFVIQIFRTAKGPAILVRHEDRGKGTEYLFVYVKDELVLYRWEKTLPEDFELVHDPGSRAEAEIANVEANALIREKAVLVDCLQAALGMLDERSAEQVRDIWRQRIKTHDIISLTRGG